MTKRAKSRRKSAKPLRLYTIKVALDRVRPPIWRRIVVRSDAALGDLHSIIQEVMGWCGGHLHRLEINGIGYSGDREFGSGSPADLDCEHEDTTTVGQTLPPAGGKFTYEYDFGDGWMHTCAVEKIEPAPPGARVAACLAGKRRCPPEDCGGPWGYAHLLELLADPALPDPDGLREWIGAGFDAAEFDAASVDKRLA